MKSCVELEWIINPTNSLLIEIGQSFYALLHNNGL